MMKKIGLLSAILLFLFPAFMVAQEIDLIEQASQVKWRNSDGQTITFGLRQEVVGIAKYEQDVILEDGKQYKRVLLTHPQGKGFGTIIGVFSGISIPQEGGKLIIAGGFIQGAQRTDGAKFFINFMRAGEQEEADRKIRVRRRPGDESRPIGFGEALCAFDAKYDSKIDRVECDLSQIAGQTGDIIFIVQAGASPDYDWAVWTEAKLVFDEKPKADLHQTLSGHNNRIYRASFSPNGKYVVTASGDNSAKIWDVSTGKIVRTLSGHSSHVFHARFSPDNKFVVTAGGDIAILWEVSTGTEIRRLRGHSELVLSSNFSPDGAVIVTTSEDGTAKLWNARTGNEIRTFEVTEHRAHNSAFHPNGRSVAIGAQLGLLGLWNVSNGQKIRSFEGHRRVITSVSFSPNGSFLVSSSIDNTTRIWEVSSGKPRQTFRGDSFEEANLSPDGNYVIAATDAGVAKVWRIQDGEEILTIEHSSPAFRVLSATFSPDGKYIVTAGDDQTAKIWRVTLK